MKKPRCKFGVRKLRCLDARLMTRWASSQVMSLVKKRLKKNSQKSHRRHRRRLKTLVFVFAKEIYFAPIPVDNKA